MGNEPVAAGDEKKLSPVGIATAVIAAALTFYFMSEYAGPYRWAAELQMSVLGSFSQKLSFLLAFLGTWAAVGLVALPLRRLATRDPAGTPSWAGPPPAPGGPGLPPVPGTVPAGAGAAVPAAAAPPAVELPPAKRPAGRLADLGLALLLMGAVLAYLGGRDYVRGSAGGTIADATVAEFEAGRPPASTWVRVTGVPLADVGVSYGTSRSSPDLYVPLAAAPAAADGPPPATAAAATGPAGTPPSPAVRLFAKFRSKTLPSGRVEGLVNKNGLPGPVRTAMEDAGVLAAGGDHWVIEAGKDPARTKSLGGNMALIGSAMVAAGLLLNVNRFRRR